MSGSGSVDKRPIGWLVSPTSGADPEIFLSQNGKVIGAETAIPKEGINSTSTYSAVVLDGVQVELHPGAGGCRQEFCARIAGAFKALAAHLKGLEAKGQSITACFDQTIKMKKEDLEKLSAESQALGCMPSESAYDEPALDCKGKVVTTRSAGGHIHLGTTVEIFNGYETVPYQQPAPKTPPYPGYVHPVYDYQRFGTKIANKKDLGNRLSKMLDIFLGIPCVLIDRDPGAAERRKLYGKAGEHRLPKHGVEYRVLSNFWLRHFILAHFVLGQARLASNVLATSTRMNTYGPGSTIPQPFDAENLILEMVDLDTVRRAINNNDVELAWKCWEPIASFTRDHIPSPYAGITSGSVTTFEALAKRIQEKGLSDVFPVDPFVHWTNPNWNYQRGWEQFIVNYTKSTVINY